jgi:hypothetical protein
LFFCTGLEYGLGAAASLGDDARARAQLTARLDDLERRVPPSVSPSSAPMDRGNNDNDDDDDDAPLVMGPPLLADIVRRLDRLAAAASAAARDDDAVRRCAELQSHLAAVLRQSREREQRAAEQRDEAVRRTAEMQHQLTMVLQQSHEREQGRLAAIAQRDEALQRLRVSDASRGGEHPGDEAVARLRTELFEARHTIAELRAVRLPDAVAHLTHRVDELTRANHKLVGQVVLSHTERQELILYRKLHFDPVCSPASPFDALAATK